jgi:hypothetical protein
MTAGLASAGCVDHRPSSASPADWVLPESASSAAASALAASDAGGAGVVGMWKFAVTSDGTAYPVPIPFGAPLDFGTWQWHGDGTEIMLSGGRPPSSADVCMGVWKQTGERTYKVKHIGLSWASADTLPPASPAVFLGPAIIEVTVTLSRSRTAFEGTFTVDQYAADGATLIEHVGGKVVASRVTLD